MSNATLRRDRTAGRERQRRNGHAAALPRTASVLDHGRYLPAEIVPNQPIAETITDALPQFGVEASEISRDAKFEDLDVDSLDLTEISQIIEEEYGVALKGDDARNLETVGDAIDMVVTRAG